MTGAVLAAALDAALLLWMERLRTVPPEQRQARAADLPDASASNGDRVLHRFRARGGSAAASNALAEALAPGALRPGGVTAFGRRWCAGHAACAEAAQARGARQWQPTAS
jgi:hypothetical protein